MITVLIISKTQITLLNKRVGSEAPSDSLWISEISPSRTEVRLLPLKRGLQLNPELKKRFDLFINNGEFRDDTINLAFNFIEKVNPSVIDNFLKSKYNIILNAGLITAGIMSKKFTSCVNDMAYQGWVNNVAAAGAKANVNSTPTVFINGKEIDRKTEYFSADKFKAAVERG